MSKISKQKDPLKKEQPKLPPHLYFNYHKKRNYYNAYCC
jgi:hypothetical protein